ncbi:MAG: aldehyde dehydrogenase (NADP(+)) [Chitinophagaceae bacterium]|nr:aldehyde dehydrogenase (NADP(+)) [Chitinophagaceae bacterium]
MVQDSTIEEINVVMQEAWQAFHQYRQQSLSQRSIFIRTIALELEALGDELLRVASAETNLPEARLRNERNRTIFQLSSYADACEQGSWLEARIDTAIPDRNPPRVDIRKMMIPLGPVVVFGASNFPFAYSTAGGDTASAFAAGCTVVVKAHPAHAQTSDLVAGAIFKAADICKMPKGIFAHVHGTGHEVGRALVTHPYTKAVGFTGSYTGGKALFEWGNQRKEPIPVFAEMGSVNPVFLLPEKLQQSAEDLARMVVGSVTLGVGQFCTNPGLIIAMEGEPLQRFLQILALEVKNVNPGTMLHPGIAKGYTEKRASALSQRDVDTIAVSSAGASPNQGVPTIASASAQAFLNNPVLHEEVFGPYSIVIRCKDIKEMIEVARHTEGQLTCSVMATDNDLLANADLVEALKNICGRFIVNNVPTGVEVCLSMHHGGPYPATTDSRFTSVGADAIKRFARPICLQNWSDILLPDELKNENPFGIWRTVNNELTKDAIK